MIVIIIDCEASRKGFRAEGCILCLVGKGWLGELGTGPGPSSQRPLPRVVVGSRCNGWEKPQAGLKRLSRSHDMADENPARCRDGSSSWTALGLLGQRPTSGFVPIRAHADLWRPCSPFQPVKMTSTLSPPLPPNNAPPGMPLALAASPHASHLRPALNPSPPSALSLTPIHSSSSSDCSTPQRTSSTSSQSSTASIPARPIRPPPIETRTKASKPEQVFGATSLRDALNASTSRADNAGADSERVLTRGTGSGLGTAIAGRGKPPGFVVHGGRRGSGGAAVGTAPGGKKIVTGQAPIGRSSFKFGEELGRGSFSVVSGPPSCFLFVLAQPRGATRPSSSFLRPDSLLSYRFFQVLKATHLATSQPYAVKILDKHHLRTHKKEKYATVEVEALKRLTASPPSASQPPTPTTPRATPTTPTFPPRSMSNSMSDSTIRASPTKPRAGSGADATEDRIKDVEKGKERAKGGHPGVVKLYWAFQDESSLCE